VHQTLGEHKYLSVHFDSLLLSSLKIKGIILFLSMVSIGSKARPSEYYASILTSGSMLAAVSMFMLLLWLYPMSLCSMPYETRVCVRLTNDVFPYYDKLTTSTSQEELTHPRSNQQPVSSFSSFEVFYAIILRGVATKSKLRKSDF
jgi:hypothetical protein